MKDYWAGRQAVVLADLSHWDHFVFSGPDRQKVLHSLLTNNIASLAPQQGCHTCLLTPKGKLLGNFSLYNRGADFWAPAHPAVGHSITAALARYLPFSQTTIQAMGQTSGAFYLTGPLVERFLRSAFSLAGLPGGYACVPVAWQRHQLWLAFYPEIALAGWLILMPRESLSPLRQFLFDLGKDFSLEPMGSQALEALRVESGHAQFGLDMDSDTLALEANLERAISFNKGCYVGQEIISRIKTQGHINKILCGLRLPAAVSPQSPVYAGETQVGVIKSIVFSPILNAYLALVMLRVEQAHPGKELGVMIDEKRESAQVVSLPVEFR